MIRVHQILTRRRSLSDFLGEITLRSSTVLIGGGVGNRTVVIGSTRDGRTNVSGTSYQDHRRLPAAYQYHRSCGGGEVAGLQLQDKRLTLGHFLRAQSFEGPNSSRAPTTWTTRTTKMEAKLGAGRGGMAARPDALARSPSSPTGDARTTRSIECYERDAACEVETGLDVTESRMADGAIALVRGVQGQKLDERCGCS
jgi:hypothetical protein